ncbi:MAG TPA: polyprenyl synthetase family protein, partial [Terriglobia bacterium]|nr:polyprenyl synthetase family protein [Terriglobia bacterium]
MSIKSPEHFTISSWLEVLEPVRPELDLVEKRFRAELVSPVPAVTSIGQYLQVSGGKRLRPALLLLAAKALGATGPAAIAMGAVVEMIH